MAILVVGGAGFIGSQTVNELIDAGNSVVVLDNLSTGFRSAVPEGAGFVEGDAGDSQRVSQLLHKYDISDIIHFAASIVVPESVRDPLSYYRNNTMNTRNLLKTAIESDVRRFIFSSTAAVYGNPERVPVSEAAAPDPMSPYGRSKLMSEWMIRDAQVAYGLQYAILRYFNVAGADPQLRTGQSSIGATHLIKVAVEAALGERPFIDVFGDDYPTADGTCIRDYIHVSDLAQAHIVVLAHLRAGGESETFNCGYGHGVSVFEVINAVKQAAGRDFKVNVVRRRAGDPAAVIADSAKLRTRLKWRPQFDNLDTIIGHSLAWERKARPDGAQPNRRERDPQQRVR